MALDLAILDSFLQNSDIIFVNLDDVADDVIALLGLQGRFSD